MSDLSNKTVEELAAYFGQLHDQSCNAIVAFDELASRLAKAQAEINRRVESAWKLEEEIARMRPVVEAVMERHADNKFSGWLGKWCEDYEAGEKP